MEGSAVTRILIQDIKIEPNLPSMDQYMLTNTHTNNEAHLNMQINDIKVEEVDINVDISYLKEEAPVKCYSCGFT